MHRSTLARRRNGRFLRNQNDGGGGGQNGGGASDNGGGAGGDNAGSGAGGSGSSGGGSGGTDRGFPENTPLVEMSTEQQLAYHRFHSRKWQERAESRADYDAVKAKAAEFDQLKASQATDQEKAVNAARDEGKAEATRIANEKAVKAILRGALTAKGKTGDELTTLVDAANPAAFMTDGEADADKVTSYAASIAGTGGGGSGGGDTGQGRREQRSGSGLASGRERYENRRGKKTAASN